MGKIFKLGIIVLALIVASIVFMPTVFGAELSHYYKFENISSTVFILDEQQRADGTVPGSFSWLPNFPVFNDTVTNGSNMSGNFDQVFDVIQIPTMQWASNDTTPFGISVWLKPRNLNQGGELDTVFYGEDAGSDNIWIRATGGNSIQFNMRNGGGGTETVATPINFTLDTWFHLVAEWNLTHINIYLNGSIQDSSAVTTRLGINTHRIGSFSGAVHTWNGTIDEMKFFNSSLNTTAVKNLHTFGNTDGNVSAPAPPTDDTIVVGDLFPINGTNVNVTFLPINVSVNSTGLFNASLFVDGILNSTQFGLPSGTNVFVNFNISFTLAEIRELTIRINVTNGFNATGNFTANDTTTTNTIFLNRENNSISISNLNPVNGTETNTLFLPINATVTSTGLFNASLFVDGIINATQFDLPSGSNVFVNFNLTFDSTDERELTIRIDVTDGFNSTGNFSANASSTTNTIIINNQAPIITLNNPSDGEDVDNTIITFNWTVTDGFVINSTLHVFNETGVEVFTNTSTSSTTLQVVSLVNGTYFWNVTAADNNKLTV